MHVSQADCKNAVENKYKTCIAGAANQTDKQYTYARYLRILTFLPCTELCAVALSETTRITHRRNLAYFVRPLTINFFLILEVNNNYRIT